MARFKCPHCGAVNDRTAEDGGCYDCGRPLPQARAGADAPGVPWDQRFDGSPDGWTDEQREARAEVGRALTGIAVSLLTFGGLFLWLLHLVGENLFDSVAYLLGAVGILTALAFWARREPILPGIIGIIGLVALTLAAVNGLIKHPCFSVPPLGLLLAMILWLVRAVHSAIAAGPPAAPRRPLRRT